MKTLCDERVSVEETPQPDTFAARKLALGVRLAVGRTKQWLLSRQYDDGHWCAELEGDIDLRGFLGLADDVPKGFTEIRVRFKVKADVDNMEALKRLTSYSPVFNTITQGAKVNIQVEPK